MSTIEIPDDVRDNSTHSIRSSAMAAGMTVNEIEKGRP